MRKLLLRILTVYERIRFIVYGLILGLSVSIILYYLRAKPEERADFTWGLVIAVIAITFVICVLVFNQPRTQRKLK